MVYVQWETEQCSEVPNLALLAFFILLLKVRSILTYVCNYNENTYPFCCLKCHMGHRKLSVWPTCFFEPGTALLMPCALCNINHSLICEYFICRFHSFIPLACAECDDSLPFSGASSIPLCYVLFPATVLYQPFFHPLSPHLAIYFLVYLSMLLPNSYIIPFWEFHFLPFSVHAQTNIIYLTLLSL